MRGLRERLLAVPTGAVTPPPVFLLSVRSDAVHPNPVEVEDYRTVLLGLSPYNHLMNACPVKLRQSSTFLLLYFTVPLPI